MDQIFLELKQAATDVIGLFRLRENSSAGSAAAALRTVNGKIYTGICLDFASGLGFCAEHAAIAEMLKARETQIQAILAIGADDHGVYIMPPCGRCRELIAQVDTYNWNTQVAIAADKILSLRELLPQHWMPS